MEFVITTDATEFRDHAWEFVEPRIECNVIATVLLAVLDGRYDDVAPTFAYRPAADGSVDAVAMRTAPYGLLVSNFEPAAADRLVGAWLDRDSELPGCNGGPEIATAIADAWRARTGGAARRLREMAIHELEVVVDPPRPPAGRLRLAQRSERELMIEWWRAFAAEADSAGAPRAAATVDARLEDDCVLVWDDGGPVSLVAISLPVAGVVRIGPVYTPPDKRRRGYAGMAVAEVSRRALAGGATRCTLFTDLANPTSNKIYAEVGYRRIADWEEYAFERP